MASRRFVDCDQLAELLRGGSGEYTQIGAGECKGSITRFDFDGFHLLLTDISNRTVFRGATDAAHQVISIPLRWSGTLSWNGRVCDHPVPIFWRKGREFVRTGENARIASLIFDAGALRDQVAAWTGGAPESWDALTDKMLPDTTASRRFVSLIGELLIGADRQPQHVARACSEGKVADRLFASFARAVESGLESSVSADSPALKESRIVRQVADFVDAHLDQDVSLMDLCRATDRSARTIEYAVGSVLQMSPTRYLRLRRLARVRTLLREASPAEMNVSQCAYAAGFSHLGRFSIEYREHFGEHPSQTLRRGRDPFTG